MSKEKENKVKDYRLQSNITKTEETKKGDWIVWGYASTFDVDSGGDQITKEALLGAQDDFVEYSTVLFNHTFDRPIGKVVDTLVDDIGLLIKVVLSKTEKELWTKVKEGIVSKFSVAGRILEETQTDNGIYQINKIRFHEVSLVSVPANKKAEAVDDYVTKSQKDNDMDITNKLKEIAKTRTAKEIKENIHLLVDTLEAGIINTDEHIKNSSIADIFAEWTNVEKNEIAIYASSDGSGDIDKIDWNKYKECFAWCDPDNAKSFSGYKLQHHTVKDGKLVVVWKGVADAMTELLGVKGKANIPNADVENCYEHLAQHYGQFDKQVPEKTVSYELLEDEDNAMINGLQVLAGKLSGVDKEAVDSAIGFIQTKNADLTDTHKQICNFDDESDDRPVYQLNSSTEIDLAEDGTFRKQILKYGKWYHWAAHNGELKITKELVSNIVNNFKQNIIENVSVPLTHRNADDPSNNTGQVVDLIQTEKGLDAIIEVKDKSIVQKIKDDLIKCISASIDPNYRVKTSNKFVGATLLHAALVQEPYIKGMRGFVPLSDDFAGRPIFQFEDTELSVQQELINIKQQLIKLSMEHENDNSTDDTKKEDDIENKDNTDETTDNTDETKDTDAEDATKSDETKDDKDKKDEDTEEKTDEVSDEEISKSFDATLDECAQELVKSSKIDKSKYTECVKTQMKNGKKLGEAVKVCKAKVKKQLSEVESEDKKSDETKDVQQTDNNEKVDMSDAEDMYKTYLEKGQIVPAQKEAFIQLFASTKALNLGDDKVELHKILKTFLDAQSKTVDFDEKGTDVNDDTSGNDSLDDDMPDDVKKFYSEKMGFDDETAKEAWSHAKELKAQEDEMKETVFGK